MCWGFPLFFHSTRCSRGCTSAWIIRVNELYLHMNSSTRRNSTVWWYDTGTWNKSHQPCSAESSPVINAHGYRCEVLAYSRMLASLATNRLTRSCPTMGPPRLAASARSFQRPANSRRSEGLQNPASTTAWIPLSLLQSTMSTRSAVIGHSKSFTNMCL